MVDGTPLLRVSGLKKHFQITEGVLQREVGRVRAVDGIDFEIRRGETFGLIGETGCGKSTAARTLLRLEEPTAGTVTFDGEPVTDFGGTALKRFRRRAQMIFQDPTSSFDPRMRLGESIAEPLRAHGLSDKAEREQLVETMLGHVGLAPETAQDYPHELSGGQKQRAALARALVVNPELLVADEPVSALDVSVQAEILELLDELQDAFDLSVLFITHDMNVVREICDRVAVMYLGEIVEMGPTGSLLEAPKHPYTRALVASIPSIDPAEAGRQGTLSGEVPDPSNPPSGCRFHTRCPEIIPPDQYDLKQSDWRAIANLRVQLADPDAEPVDFAGGVEPTADDANVEAATVRAAFDFPESLGDESAEAELAAALELIADGDLDAAAATLEESFSSPCIGEWPEMRETAADHPVACHLHPAD